MNFSYITLYVCSAVLKYLRIKRIIVKTLKENEPNVTKDVLLHQIFQEISDENIEINDDPYLDEIIPIPKRKLSKIRKIQKKWQWFFIVVLVICIIYVLFTQSEEQQPSNDTYTIPKAIQTSRQEKATEPLDVLNDEEKKVDIIIEPNPIQITEESPIVDNHIENKNVEKKSIDTKPKTVIKPEKPKSEKEKAKEALLRQMQN